LAGETEVLGENLPQQHSFHHKSHLTRPRARTRAAAVGSQQLTAWARRGLTSGKVSGSSPDEVDFFQLT
jgi:hypothetical protein